MNISYLYNFSYSFFCDSIVPNINEKNPKYGLPVYLTLGIISLGEIPFQNLAFAIDHSDCFSFGVRSYQRVPVYPLCKKMNYSPTKKIIALSVMIAIPCKIITLSLKICLFVFSHEFRKMQHLLTRYHIEKNQIVISNQKSQEIATALLPEELWIEYAHFFSLQDLGRLATVDKSFNVLATKMLQKKVSYLTEVNENVWSFVKDEFGKIGNFNDQEVIEALGGEGKIVFFPPVTIQPTNISLCHNPQTKELFKRSPVVRNLWYTEFAMRCRNTNTNTRGILTFRGYNLKFNRCEWTEDGSTNSNFLKMNYRNLKKLINHEITDWDPHATYGSDSLSLELIPTSLYQS